MINKSNWWYWLSSVILGAVIFNLNSITNLNYIFKSYIVLLEAQASILLILFITGKLPLKQRNLS